MKKQARKDLRFFLRFRKNSETSLVDGYYTAQKLKFSLRIRQ